MEAVKPVRVLNEYVHTIRAHLAGGSVHFDGELEKLRGSHMEFGKEARIPVYVASTGPQVLNLAGRVGDGVLLSAGLTLESCRRCLAAADAGAKAAGRDAQEVRKAGFINFNVSKDGKAAKAALLRKLAFLFRSRGHAENIKSSGLDINHQGIMDALSCRDLDAATRLLPEKAASVFGVAGTPDECGELLQRYLSIGLTEPVIEVSGAGGGSEAGPGGVARSGEPLRPSPEAFCWASSRKLCCRSLLGIKSFTIAMQAPARNTLQLKAYRVLSHELMIGRHKPGKPFSCARSRRGSVQAQCRCAKR